MIHLKPQAFEAPFFTLFQRNLLDACRNIDVELAEQCSKYFLHHASQWLSSKNVALWVHSEVPLFCTEAVKASSFPDTVDTKALLKNRKSRLRDFFTSESRAAPWIFMPGINPKFWKAIDNNNHSTKRCIGRLKSIIRNKVDNKAALSLVNSKPRAYLCSMEFNFNSLWTKSP